MRKAASRARSHLERLVVAAPQLACRKAPHAHTPVRGKDGKLAAIPRDLRQLAGVAKEAGGGGAAIAGRIRQTAQRKGFAANSASASPQHRQATRIACALAAARVRKQAAAAFTFYERPMDAHTCRPRASSAPQRPKQRGKPHAVQFSSAAPPRGCARGSWPWQVQRGRCPASARTSRRQLGTCSRLPTSTR